MLVSLLVASLCLAQQDTFLSEYGEHYDLDGLHPFPNPEVGVVVCRFDFQSTIQDVTTGDFLIPDFSFAYSLEEDGVNPATYVAGGHTWIFGGPHLAPPEQVLSFNSVTGEGEAKAFLPLNYVGPQHFWGQPPLGRSWMTVYWGVGDEVAHDGLTPPAYAQGSKAVQLDTTFPTISIVLRENHALVLDQESELAIVASAIESFDRVFTLTVQDPGYLDIPASLTIPAGQQSVIAALVPRQVGVTRIRATSDTYPNVVFRSQKSEARPPVIITQEQSPAEPPGTGAGLPNRYCVHTKPSTPNGGPDGSVGSTNTVCGGCAPSAPYQDVCDTPIGSVIGAYEEYRCPWTLFDACFEKSGYTQFSLSNWQLMEKTLEKCDLSGWSSIASDFWDIDRYRICCRYERVDGEFIKTLKDCY